MEEVVHIPVSVTQTRQFHRPVEQVQEVPIPMTQEEAKKGKWELIHQIWAWREKLRFGNVWKAESFLGVESGWFSCLSWLFFWGCPAECFEREVDHAKKGKETTQGGQHLPAAAPGSPGPRSDNSSACEAPAGWDFLGEPWCSYGFFPGSCWVFKDEFLQWWTHSKLEARNFAARWCKKLKFQFQWGKRNLVFFKPEWWNTNPKLSSRKLMEFGGLWRSGSYTNFQTCGPENCFWYLLIRKWYTSLKSWSRSRRSNSWWSRPLRFQCTWHRTLMKVGMEGEIHAWW